MRNLTYGETKKLPKILTATQCRAKGAPTVERQESLAATIVLPCPRRKATGKEKNKGRHGRTQGDPQAFCKGPESKYFPGFAGHMVSAPTP